MSGWSTPNLLRDVARSRPKIGYAGPTLEQVQLVVALGELSRAIVEHTRRVMAHEPADWSELADLLGVGARDCRRQAIVDLDVDDVGDSGGR